MSSDSKPEATTHPSKAAMVLECLEGKFGVVPLWVRNRIRSANWSTLDHWLARAHFVPHLHLIFDTSVDVWALHALADVVRRMEADIGPFWPWARPSVPTTRGAED